MIPNIDSADLWSQISTMPRAHRVVPFPRNDIHGVAVGNVAIVVLTGDEVAASTMGAERAIREASKKELGEVPKTDEQSDTFRSMYNSRATREILFRSCRRADACQPDDRGVCVSDHSDLKKLFPTLESIGKMSTDEQAVLMRHYLQTQAEVGPIVSSMSQAEMDAWIEVLGKGGSRAPLALLSTEQASELLMYMASQIDSSQTVIGSAGTPQDSPT